MSFDQGITVALEGDTTLQTAPLLTAQGIVSLGADTSFQIEPRTTMLMILQGGPLDREQQIVESLPTNADSLMYFNLPHYQIFDQNGDVVARGLEAVYTYLGPGPPPVSNDTVNDTWLVSHIFGFAGEVFGSTGDLSFGDGTFGTGTFGGQ